MIYLAKEIQETVEKSVVIGTGYSWLRQFAPYIAAGVLKKGWAKMIGFGREAFAYPDFAYDLLYNGGFKANKVCLTCGKCTDLKSTNRITGCVVRDKEIYLPFYSNIG